MQGAFSSHPEKRRVRQTILPLSASRSTRLGCFAAAQFYVFLPRSLAAALGDNHNLIRPFRLPIPFALSLYSHAGEGQYVNRAALKGIVDEEVSADVRDLSTVHEPLGALLDALPSSAAAVAPLRLSEEQVAQYFRDGFLTNVPVLTEAQCDLLLEQQSELTQPDQRHAGHGLFHEFHSNQSGDPNNVLLHALGHWRIQPAFHDLVFVPSITVPASQLIREDMPESAVRFWHDQLFAKPPHHGGNVAWHQDYSYWTRTGPMQHLTVHVALDAQTEENGAIMYIPGSHRWHRDGMPLPITADDFGNMDSIQAVLTDAERAAFKPVAAELKRGHASFHHPLSVHGSFGNRSARPRRAAVVNYFADGTISKTDTALLAGVPPILPGEMLQGQFFPVVYDPAWV